MNSLQFWIWVAIVIISLIARNKKKQQKNTPPFGGDDPFNNPSPPDTKPITFEDLLREIQSSKNIPVSPASPQAETPAERPEYVNYDLEEEVVERVDGSKMDQDKTFDTYEKAKQAAFNRPSLEETMKIENTPIRFGYFKGYQQENQVMPALAYVKDLQDVEGLKKAFILSEILNRKF